MFENLFFVIFPYAAIVLAVVVTVLRFKKGFTLTSLSSQFLEGRELFYGSVPWHFGILTVLAGHLIGLFFPAGVLGFNSVPWRLYLLEITGLLFGLLALTGLIALVVRRLSLSRIRAVTSPLDLAVLLLLLNQVATGLLIAVLYRWGSNWYAISAVPYLRSLFTLQPDINLISPLPLLVKLHLFNAYLIVAVFPFSRLIHALAFPIHYLWRPFQVVIWSRDRKRSRMAAPQQQGRPDATPVAGRSKTGKPVYSR
jgi:nitrate reductase gamma subunit